MYILELNKKSIYEYSKYNRRFYNYDFEMDYPVLTAEQSLKKSIESLRQFYDNEILLICNTFPDSLKNLDVKFRELDKDPAFQRIPILLENLGDFGVFIEHDVTFFKSPTYLFGTTFTSMGPSKRPFEFGGDFFGIHKSNAQKFFEIYENVQKLKGFPKFQKVVFGTRKAFMKLECQKIYDLIGLPHQDPELSKSIIGIHTHFDLPICDLKFET